MRFLVLFFLSLSQLYAEVPATIFGAGPNGYQQCVNVLSGHFMLKETDLIVPGPLPLCCERVLVNSYFHWHSTFLGIISEKEGKECYYEEPANYAVNFSKKGEVFRVDQNSSLNKGLTNQSFGAIGGETNPKNYQIQKGKDQMTLTEGDGTKKTLTLLGSSKWEGTKLNTFHLHHVCKPDGNQFRFSKEPRLQEEVYQSLSPDGSVRYCEVKETTTPMDLQKWTNSRTMKAEDGREVRFHQSLRYIRNSGTNYRVIDRVERPNAPTMSYSYNSNNLNLTEAKAEGGNFLRVTYDEMSRAEKLIAPVGENNAAEWTHSYQYALPDLRGETFAHKGTWTKVENRLGGIQRFRVNDKKQIHCVKKTKTRQLNRSDDYFETNYTFGDGDLLNETVTDRERNFLYRKEMEYDAAHNVHKEKQTLYDNSYTIEKTFSADEYHLPLTEWDGHTLIRYVYLPKTNLVAAKFIGDKKKIVCREFFHYDAFRTCIYRSIDDGSSVEESDLSDVTERRITRITPNKVRPCIGYPLVETESYLDLSTGKEVQLRRVENRFSREGWLVEKRVFDASDSYCYTLNWDYHRFGKPTYERDGCGGEIFRTYDGATGNLLEEKRGDLTRSFSYDVADRLKTVTENGTRRTEYTYNLLSQKVSEKDPTGALKRFSYDDHDHIAEIHLPNGGVHKREFDYFGNVTKDIDAEGRVTETRYTLLNKPLDISYSDGTQETFTYDSSMVLTQSVDREGVITNYTHDCLGREIEKTIFSPERELLQRWKKNYLGERLVSEEDPLGLITYYEYDGAGRKISEKRGSTHTTYEYDSLGRLSVTKEWLDPSHFRATVRTYDFLDRVIEEHKEDETGTIYEQVWNSYDKMGRLIEQNVGGAITTMRYDPWGRLIEKKDPVGAMTHIVYHEGGEKITQTTTEPDGRNIIEVYDAMKNLLSTEINHVFHPISKNAKSYDKVGNCIQLHQWIYHGFAIDREVDTFWEYNTENLPIEQRESQKVTRYAYTTRKQKKEVTKPDGVKIIYSYNPLGYLTHLYTTGPHPVDYLFENDSLGRPLQIKDQIQQRVNSRTYDAEGRVREEVLGNGLTITTSFDSLGRLTEEQLPTGSSILFDYDSNYLQSVTYEGHTHRFTKYNARGELLEMTHANQLQTTYTRDLLGRVTSSHNPSLHEESISYDLVGNLTSYISDESKNYRYDPLRQLIEEPSCHYSYDSNHNRLTKNQESFTYNDLNQRTDLSYDLCGNLLSLHNNQLEYDDLDRLIVVHSGGKKIHYTYDSFHRRITKNKTNYLYLGDNEMGAFGDCNELRILGPTPQAESGSAVLLILDKTVYVPHHDLFGNVAVLTTLSGEVKEKISYTAFGETKGEYLSPYRYRSKRFDPETALTYFGRRYYDASSGRWITCDPKGFNESPNLYAYVLNSPLTHFDLYGLEVGWSAPSFQIRPMSPSLSMPFPMPDCNPRGIYYSPGTSSLRPSISYTNGIYTNYQGASNNTRMLQAVYGGAPTFLNYNRTQGPLDLSFRCSFEKGGGLSKSATLEAACIRYRLANEPKNSLIACHYHSEGGIIGNLAMKQLSPEDKSRLAVFTYGTGQIISNDKREFPVCVNYIGYNDIIPKLTNPNYMARAKRENVPYIKFINTGNYPLPAHYFESYIDGMTDSVKQYDEANEKYRMESGK